MIDLLVRALPILNLVNGIILIQPLHVEVLVALLCLLFLCILDLMSLNVSKISLSVLILADWDCELLV